MHGDFKGSILFVCFVVVGFFFHFESVTISIFKLESACLIKLDWGAQGLYS
jgi:hypothetical protein